MGRSCAIRALVVRWLCAGRAMVYVPTFVFGPKTRVDALVCAGFGPSRKQYYDKYDGRPIFAIQYISHKSFLEHELRATPHLMCDMRMLGRRSRTMHDFLFSDSPGVTDCEEMRMNHG